MRRWIYGVGFPEGNEAIYVKRFEGHIEGSENTSKIVQRICWYWIYPKGMVGTNCARFWE